MLTFGKVSLDVDAFQAIVHMMHNGEWGHNQLPCSPPASCVCTCDRALHLCHGHLVVKESVLTMPDFQLCAGSPVVQKFSLKQT
jgi:hypothetical protein